MNKCVLRSIRLGSLFLVALAAVACGPGNNAGGAAGGQQLSGEVRVDGSSTVGPVSQAMAEEFRSLHPRVNVTVSESGTGGGMKKLLAGEIDICGASRPIKAAELETAKKNGIEFVELPIAFDGLSIVVHPEATFVDHLTVEELRRIWSPDSRITNWSQVRAGFPDLRLSLFGPGSDSGTFDYFTEAVVGDARASRNDYQASEDDNQLVQGVAGTPGALGYFGYEYYVQNQNRLRIVPIDNGNGPVEPNPETIESGTYEPLSRPLFIYINAASLEKPHVRAFVDFYLGQEGRQLVRESGYIRLPDTAYELAAQRVQNGVRGSVFSGAPVGMKLEELLQREPTGQ
jgi:phosphate transport system substrate-binding protein